MGQNIPWRRVLVEGVVIVVSILLAFGIEAWWGRWQQSERTEGALRNLEAGFAESVSLIDEELRRVESFQERLRLFLAADSGEIEETAEDIDRALRAIARPVVNNLNSEELILLLEDDALRSLDAPDLRAATAAWRNRWRAVVARHESLYQLQEDVLRALALNPSTRSAVTESTAAAQIGDDALRVARQDQDLVALAAVKASHWRVLQTLYDQLGASADSMITLIRAERDR